MERHRLLVEFTTIAVFAAGVVVAGVDWVASIVNLSGTTGLASLILRWVSVTGAYFLILRTFISLYFRLLWRTINIQRYLGGEWRYAYNDSYDENTDTWTDPDRYGTVTITHTAEDIHFDGRSEGLEISEPPLSASSVSTVRWGSTSATIDGLRVFLSLELGAERNDGKGFAQLQIVPRPGFLPRPPREIAGRYVLVFERGVEPRRGRIRFWHGDDPGE